MLGSKVAKVEFESVWQKQVTDAEVKILWLEFGNPDFDAWDRNMVVVAKNEFQQIIGIVVTKQALVRQMKNEFYLLHIIVHPFWRLQGVGAELLTRAINILEQDRRTCCGILCLIQSEELKTMNEAVWPKSNLVYIGNNSKGAHIRVRYFSGAKLQGFQ